MRAKELNSEMDRLRIVLSITLLIFSAFSSAAGDVFGEEAPKTVVGDAVVKEGEVLNLDRCIEIAFMKQPSIAAARSTLDASQSAVGQAKANYYPQVDLNSSYQEIEGSSGISKAAGTTSEFTTSFQLSQNLFDFGATTSRVDALKFTAESSRMDLENAILQTAFNVKQTYFGVLRAKRNKSVAEEVVSQFEKHLEQAQSLYSVGIKPKFDVTRAGVDVSNAKLSLLKADNALQIAWANLNNAMGVPGVAAHEIEDILSYKGYDITFKDALEIAYANRPDMTSLLARKRAAEEEVKVAKTGYYPTLTGNAQYGWIDVDSTDSSSDFWNVGATLTFPIFNGFLTKHEVNQAKAIVNVLEADETLLRQAIYLDVEQAYLTLKNVEEQIPAAELVVKQAQENFDIVNGMYTAGLANPIEVTDAQVSLSDAKNAYIQALFDYHLALATLELAMGKR